MNPIYKFELTAGASTQRAYPIYKDDLALDYAKESGEEFFRAKLNGKLMFESDDYTFIEQKAFDTQFVVEIFISRDAGSSWTSYWKGTFWKTDCEFDADAQIVSVQPTVWDQYNDILAGIDKEYNLIELAPEINEIKADKRPMVQVYVPGQSVIGCFLSGMGWEQECDVVNESDTVRIGNTDYPALTHKYHFELTKGIRQVDITQMGWPEIPNVFYGNKPSTTQYEYTNGEYKFRYTFTPVSQAARVVYEIIRVDGTTETPLWRYEYTGTNPPVLPPQSLVLQPVSGTGATGNVEIYLHDINVYSRLVTDVETAMGKTSYEIPDDDLVENNRNYRRVIGYDFPDTIYFSDSLTETPTKWGLYQPGKYYLPPYIYWQPDIFPVSRNAWGRLSIWFVFDVFDSEIETAWRKEITLKDAYPLWSVISVLLKKCSPNYDFRANYHGSGFLYPYEDNPISGLDFSLFITPKSNVVYSGYDQPAQKAPITLRDVFDMLRDCFRCYWYIDEDKQLHIEHISWFMNGKSYTPNQQEIGVDLTTLRVTRNGKPWAFARDKYKFNKPDTAGRYQFEWMDDVTQLFEGYPINILSGYVNPENIEQVSVTKFSSDFDYIVLNPGAISKDGFVLLGAIEQSGGYVLPYYNFVIDNNDHILQNGYVAFCMLQEYYAYDMPAPDYEINGDQMVAQGTKKLKEQTIQFPVITEPDLYELVKTNLGDGVIEKLSVNLSSRNATATLKYDTE